MFKNKHMSSTQVEPSLTEGGAQCYFPSERMHKHACTHMHPFVRQYSHKGIAFKLLSTSLHIMQAVALSVTSC